MSDESKVLEVVPPGEQLSDVPQSQPSDHKQESPVAVGYVVGVREDGSFVFEVLGSKPGLVELLGLHSYAKEKLDLLGASKGDNVNAIILNKLNSLLTLITNRR